MLSCFCEKEKDTSGIVFHCMTANAYETDWLNLWPHLGHV